MNIDWLHVLQDIILISVVLGVPLGFMLSMGKKHDKELWEKCIEKSKEYKVFVDGGEVDTKFVKIEDLNMVDWDFKIDDKKKEIYLKCEGVRSPGITIEDEKNVFRK